MDNETHAILREIRDLQQQHLAEYKRVAERSISLQEKAVARQEHFTVLYRRVLMVAGVVVTAGLALIAYVFSR
jgi:hypothetical protein